MEQEYELTTRIMKQLNDFIPVMESTMRHPPDLREKVFGMVNKFSAEVLKEINQFR